MLPEALVHHIHVLRLPIGAHITLFNGSGDDFIAKLTDIGKRHAYCHILSAEHIVNESPLDITLVQAVSTGERMDFTIQKSVELGVKRIRPIISERCTVRLTGERADKRIRRWQDIAIAACEQSGRSVIPEILPILTLTDYLIQIPRNELHLLMSLNRARTLHDILPTPKRIHLMIGPEGGWSNNEECVAFKAGFQSLTLGKRVLRTETASLAAIAAMQTLWGDFQTI